MKRIETLLLAIKNLRNRYGFTQAQMAEKINLSLKAWQKIEKGITKLDCERLIQIAEVLNTSAEKIFGETNPKKDLATAPAHFSKTERELYERIFDALQKRLEHYEQESIRILTDISNSLNKPDS